MCAWETKRNNEKEIRLSERDRWNKRAEGSEIERDKTWKREKKLRQKDLDGDGKNQIRISRETARENERRRERERAKDFSLATFNFLLPTVCWVHCQFEARSPWALEDSGAHSFNLCFAILLHYYFNATYPSRTTFLSSAQNPYIFPIISFQNRYSSRPNKIHFRYVVFIIQYNLFLVIIYERFIGISV